LGWAAKLLGLPFRHACVRRHQGKGNPRYLKQAGFARARKTKLIDGRTGQIFDQEISSVTSI